MNNSGSLVSIVKTIKKWFRAIVLLCALVVIAAVIISLQLDNYYKSSTVFYAASSDLAKPAPIGGFEIDLEYYGRDEDIDRLLSIANSGELANRIIDEFNLAEHYEIKTETDKGKHKVYERFYKLFKANKNKFDAIEISVEDKDPELAAKITNKIREIINEIAQRLIKESQSLQIQTYENNINSKETELKILNDSLEKLRTDFGIYDTESQGQVLAELMANTQAKTTFIDAKITNFTNMKIKDSLDYYKALKASYRSQLSNIRTNINSFNKGYSKVVLLEQEQEEFGLQLSLDKERYKQLKSAKDAQFSAIHLVEKAETPLVKSRPKRSILVMASGLIAFFFSLLSALVVERFREINWNNE